MTELFAQSHTEARRLVASGAPVYLTVNPVEYHGPHLSLHNDRLISLGLIRDLHRRLHARHPSWPLLLGADLEMGVEPASGVGSRHTPFHLVRAQVIEACRALAELGARRVVLMTFHGSPMHNVALQAGVDLLAGLGVPAIAPFHEVLRENLDLDPQRYELAVAHLASPQREEVLEDLLEDFHAGFFETSMTLLYAPESVSAMYQHLPRSPRIVPDAKLTRASRLAARAGRHTLSRELRFAALGVGWAAIDPFPGYTGRPDLATAASGRVFADAILDTYERVVEPVLDGQMAAPKPIMTWLRWVTLGGRVESPRPTRFKEFPEVVTARPAAAK